MTCKFVSPAWLLSKFWGVILLMVFGEPGSTLCKDGVNPVKNRKTWPKPIVLNQFQSILARDQFFWKRSFSCNWYSSKASSSSQGILGVHDLNSFLSLAWLLCNACHFLESLKLLLKDEGIQVNQKSWPKPVVLNQFQPILARENKQFFDGSFHVLCTLLNWY